MQHGIADDAKREIGASRQVTEQAYMPALSSNLLVPKANQMRPMLALQRRVGNRAVTSMVQGKLQIGSSQDAYEQEAEQLADQVMTTPELRLLRPQVRRKTTGDMATLEAAPENVHEVVRGPGRPLDAATQLFMEERFGQDFADVRVHTGREAAASARAVKATAYTVGQNIVFGEQMYAPWTQAGKRLLAHELVHVLQQRRAPLTIQRAGKSVGGPKGVPLIITAESFEEAANEFAKLLAANGNTEPARIVVVNSPNVRVFDEKGVPTANKFFHLNSPVQVTIGVFRHVPNSRALHPILVMPDGSASVGGKAKLKGDVDFSKDIDDQEGFNKALSGGQPTYYVSPKSTAQADVADAPPPLPIENLPEFMKFVAKGSANLPAWPSAVIPLTPQIATVNSTGSYKCMVDKNQGVQTIDRVLNLMQATYFRWEVLKLDEKLKPVQTRRATAWQAAKEGYARRMRDLEADRKTLQGDPKKQSLPEKYVRAAFAEQVSSVRETLAVVGQTAMTIINAVTGGPNQLSTEDIIDIPWKEQGEYFVRCLATQDWSSSDKYRRATSVSGAFVSVFNIEDVAAEGLTTPESERKRAEDSLADVHQSIREIDEKLAAGQGDRLALKTHRSLLLLKVDYFKTLESAAGDPHAQASAGLAYVNARISFFNSSEYPSATEYDRFKKAQLEELEKELKEQSAKVERHENRLKDYDSNIVQIGYMPALLVDEYTGAQIPLTFVVGERTRVAANELEVVIADITSEKGKVFNGDGDGFLGAGRHDAWLNAMDDLRKNLGRGRGYLSYRLPERYAEFRADLPNPMQLQMGIGAQLKEAVDDTAHALTLAAIVAAPFTGGSSLGILAVLAPIQAGSSLYNLVNRSLYDDLHLDEEAVMDLINIATLGLSQVASTGKFATKSVQIVATSSRVALRLLTAGQFVVVTFETFQALMEESDDDPATDQRLARRKKLSKLLSWFEQASIPISEKLWGEAHQSAKPQAHEGGVNEGGATLPEKGRSGPPSEGEGTRAEPSVRKTVERKGPGEPPTPSAKQPELAKAQAEVVPKGMRDYLVVNQALGRNAKVVYELGENGLIKNVELHIGPKASPADIQSHAVIVDMMLRYKGLGGRLRRLKERFENLWSDPEKQHPQVGSRAWESRLELVKLDRMMGVRHAELAKYAESDVRDAAKNAQLLDDLDSLQQQYNEHSAVLSAIELGFKQGRGYVAVEGLSAGETARIEKGYPEAPTGYYWRLRQGELQLVVYEKGKPKLYYEEGTGGKKGEFKVDDRPEANDRFEPEVDKRKAFRELGGHDATSSFGKFARMLIDMGVVSSREDIIREMQEPANLTYRTVRHNLKEKFKPVLVDRITNPVNLRKTDRYKDIVKATNDPQQALRAAAIDELKRVSDSVDSEDKGPIGELVYDKLFGDSKSWRHVQVPKEALAKAKDVDVREVEQPREIDRMDGKTVREIKNVSTALGSRERGQIEDMISMLGSKVEYKGQARMVEDVAVTFINPDGGAANARFAYNTLDIHALGSKLSFEFHTRDGKVIKISYENRVVLLDSTFASKLGVQ